MKWDSFVNTIVTFCTTSGVKLIAAILIVVVGFRIVGVVSNAFKKSKLYERLDPNIRSFLRSSISVCLKIILVITAAATLGVPMTSMIAVIGSAGLAVGLALQGSLSNIAGGFIIMIFKPFYVGDYISVGQYEGVVHSISIFYTKIYTADNKKIMIPNSVISNESLTDFTALPTRRVDLDFTVAYSSDIHEVKRILQSAADTHVLVLKDPPSVIRLAGHDSGSLRFVLRVWCNTPDYWTVYYDILESVKKAFDENGVERPSSQLDVHLSDAAKHGFMGGVMEESAGLPDNVE